MTLVIDGPVQSPVLCSLDAGGRPNLNGRVWRRVLAERVVEYGREGKRLVKETGGREEAGRDWWRMVANGWEWREQRGKAATRPAECAIRSPGRVSGYCDRECTLLFTLLRSLSFASFSSALSLSLPRYKGLSLHSCKKGGSDRVGVAARCRSILLILGLSSRLVRFAYFVVQDKCIKRKKWRENFSLSKVVAPK